MKPRYAPPLMTVVDSGEGRLVDRATPNTHTNALRVVAMSVFVLCFVGATLQLACVGVDEIATFALQRSIRVDEGLLSQGNGSSRVGSSASGSLANESSRPEVFPLVQLVPQLEVSIGFSQACFGSQCVSRSSVPEVVPMVLRALHAAEARGGLQDTSLHAAYKAFAYQFAAGYNLSGNSCPGTVTLGSFIDGPESTQGISRFGMAAGSVAVVFLSASIVLSAFLAFLLARINVVSGKTGLYADPESEMVKFGTHQVGLRFLRTEVNAHTTLEAPVVWTLFPCVGLSFAFSLCSLACDLSLFQRNLRCGSSLCSAYLDAAHEFLNRLAQVQGETPSPSVSHDAVSCSRGVSFATGLAAFIFATAAFILGVVMVALFLHSRRGQTLSRRKVALDKLAVELEQVKEERAAQQLSTAAHLRTQSSVAAMSLLASRQVSTRVDGVASFGRASPGAAEVRSGEYPTVGQFSDGNDFSNANYSITEPLSDAEANRRINYADRLYQQTPREMEPGSENTLGGRIAMLRQRKLLMREEQTARVYVERAAGRAYASLQRSAKKLIPKK